MGIAAHTSWITVTLRHGGNHRLPRQFQVLVVENVNESHLRRAMWLFPLYLLLINIFVLPIAFAGLLQFPNGGIDADTFVLTVPMQRASPALAPCSLFIGGLSAATGMIIVETVALATMVSNDLVMPLLLRFGRLHLSERKDLTGILLTIRRATIICVVLLGYGYVQPDRRILCAWRQSASCRSSAAMQFAPPILAGHLLEERDQGWRLAELSAGFAVWTYSLLCHPSPARAGSAELHRQRPDGHQPPEAERPVRPRRTGSDLTRDDVDHDRKCGPPGRGVADDLAVDDRAKPGSAVRRYLQADRGRGRI